MHPVSMRLAKLDVQADDLASVLEDARERWMAEKDPAFKAVLEIVYDEYVSREKRINARIAVLEAKLSSSQAANGEYTLSTRPICTYGVLQEYTVVIRWPPPQYIPSIAKNTCAPLPAAY